jgi:hypothetical protein
MVYQGPVAPSSAGNQGPKLQRKLLGAPRLLPQMVEALTRHSALGWVVEYCPETAGELLKIVQRPHLPLHTQRWPTPGRNSSHGLMELGGPCPGTGLV